MAQLGEAGSVSRRRLLQTALLAGAAGTATALGQGSARAAPETGSSGADTIPFFGTHQAGIATPRQANACFAAFDFNGSQARLATLMRSWSAAAQRMTVGLPATPGGGDQFEPPGDDGETKDSGPARLTVTFGFGPGLFRAVPSLAGKRPALLQTLPTFSTDALDPAICGGNLLVQACADDAIVAFHAVRMLADIGGSATTVRWMLRGCVPANQLVPQTPRNLLGFRDGTADPRPDQPSFAQTVWVSSKEGPSWLVNGTYLVIRRIRLLLSTWETATLQERQQTIGRFLKDGAPLSGGSEFTPPNFQAKDAFGNLLIPLNAHIRRAHPKFNDGVQLLRRSYSYADGSATGTEAGGLAAGLIFCAFVRSPEQFIKIQTSLAAKDGLNRYTKHVGSALFAIPPGAAKGSWVGKTLLG